MDFFYGYHKGYNQRRRGFDYRKDTGYTKGIDGGIYV